MITSTTERQTAQVLFQQRNRLDLRDSHRVEIGRDLLDEQGQLIDWLIGFAFDILGTRVLDLRVVPPEQTYPAEHY